MRPIYAFPLAALVLAGCRVELTEKWVPRLVSSGMAAREGGPCYVMTVVEEDMGERPAGAVRYRVHKGTGLNYRYVFEDGTEFWTTPRGCVMLDTERRRAQVVEGLPEAPEPAQREALRWASRRWVTANRVVARTGERELGRKGYRVVTTPQVDHPLMARTERFIDKRTKAMLLYVESGGTGGPVRRRRAERIRATRPGDYRRPGIPSGYGIIRLGAGGRKGPLPGWGWRPKQPIAVLSEPALSVSGGVVAFDMSRGGHLFVLFERRTDDEMLASPAARRLEVAGVRVHLWRMGQNSIFRWRSGAVENTAITSLPPEVAYGFLEANLRVRSGAGGAEQ